jgi:uncharacterized protein (DUF1778 family)
MIQVQDTTSALREPKSHRKDLRLKPSVLDAIERASLAVGMDASTFITSVAYRAAQDIEAAQHRSVLPTKAFDAFADAIDHPAQPNAALTDLFANRRELIADD